MKTSKVLVLPFLLTLLLCFGCWDATDIGDTDTALVASYDLAREEDKLRPEDEILLSLQIPVVDPAAQEKSFVVESSGETVGDTRPERASRAFRILSFSEIRSMLFGEALARKGITDELDIVFRNPFISYQVELAVVDGYAADLLKIKTTSIPNIGVGIANILETTPEQNFVPRVTLADFRNDEISYGRQPVLPVLSRWKKDSVQITGLALFKDGIMIAKLNRDEMKYLTLLRGDKGRGVITFPVDEKVKISIQGTNSRKVDVEMIEGRAYINIDINLVADIVEVSGSYIIDRNMERFEKVKQKAEEYITGNCQDVLDKVQNIYRTDVLKTGAVARAKYGKAIEAIDEDELFSNAEITVNTRVKIRNYGAIK